MAKTVSNTKTSEPDGIYSRNFPGVSALMIDDFFPPKKKDNPFNVTCRVISSLVKILYLGFISGPVWSLFT